MKYVSWVITSLLAVILAIVIGISVLTIKTQQAEIKMLRQKYDELAKNAKEIIEEANKPEVPVSLASAIPWIDNGLKIILHNSAGSPVEISVEVNRPGTTKTANLHVVINSDSNKEIGETEGWAFIPGDEVTLHQPGHKSIKFIVRNSNAKQ